MTIYENTLDEKIRIDKEVADIKKHSLDYSDIPQRKAGAISRLHYKEFLDMLPPDIVKELARRKLEEIKSAGYEFPEPDAWTMTSQAAKQNNLEEVMISR
jgi:hypothetical protein